MQIEGGRRLYSATDVVGFQECTHVTSLDLLNLVAPLPRAPEDESGKLVQEKGIEHEKAYLERLKASGAVVVEIQDGSLAERAEATLAAMRGGAAVIYQATLLDDCLLGFADFLVRVEQPSLLGGHSYEVWDTKLSRSPKAKFVIQLAFYSRLLAKAQGRAPSYMHVVLGDQSERTYRCADYSHYFEAVLDRFLAHVQQGDATTTAEPCSYCELCKWAHLCNAKWLAEDHLSQVANITRVQTAKLIPAGITTMAQLAAVDGATVPKMRADTLDKLRAQARLQVRARETGRRYVEVLPLDPEGRRGFYRMPKPDPGDMFFDMEGNPWEDGGLEYLFGVYLRDGGEWTFKSFWGHDRQEEGRAFEAFVDFVSHRLKTYPRAHVYHYASYEETALKRLMSLHGRREAEIDGFLRRGVLVDLYKVVREGIRVSEPRYSIKNIEHFYLEAREGAVTDAGASIVWYEKWRETRDQSLLDAIEAYNKDDVRSTQELRDWLLTQRPAGLPWASRPTEPQVIPSSEGVLTAAEARLVPYREALLDPLPPDRTKWGAAEVAQELTYQLLDFHRRADKPLYWELFARMDKTDEELLDDGECLACMELDLDVPPFSRKRSIVYTYRYPEQETKLRDGVEVTRCDTGEPLGSITMDPDARTVTITLGERREAPPRRLNLGPGKPISTAAIREALFRYADSVVGRRKRYRAVDSILRRDVPRVKGRFRGKPLITQSKVTVEECVQVVLGLDHSHLFIQGPPGSGKTYTGSHLIVSLLAAGKRVGVTSNSHKSIHNLLDAVVRVAREKSVVVRGVKKVGRDDESEYHGAGISNAETNADVFASNAQLIAGTAWLFSDPGADQWLDYLFVDEAGQVSLANLVAMGTSAKNIVLLGDQMQLAQPIQGTHPGESGKSSLEFLLGDAATIPAEKGIFLETTWRMHPDVCRFISDAVYDSRLEPEAGNVRRVLRLGSSAHPLLRPSGIVFLPVEHRGCSQQCLEEVDLISEIFRSALHQRYVDRDGKIRAIKSENILVVAPYNMQVNLLKRTLPPGTRVGTVDKFQGQEAEISVLSMTTSSEAELPRNIEFLFSKNRINVALSRAKSLAIVLASPALLQIKCSTPDQLGLVNTLCWIRGAANR